MQVYLKRMPHSLTEDDISRLAAKAHGYVGADLCALCKEAALKTIHRVKRTTDIEKLSKDQLVLTVEDMQAAFSEVRPSAMREVIIDVPQVHWNDIGGYADIKQKLQEAIELPIKVIKLLYHSSCIRDQMHSLVWE